MAKVDAENGNQRTDLDERPEAPVQLDQIFAMTKLDRHDSKGLDDYSHEAQSRADTGDEDAFDLNFSLTMTFLLVIREERDGFLSFGFADGSERSSQQVSSLEAPGKGRPGPWTQPWHGFKHHDEKKCLLTWQETRIW